MEGQGHRIVCRHFPHWRWFPHRVGVPEPLTVTMTIITRLQQLWTKWRPTYHYVAILRPLMRILKEVVLMEWWTIPIEIMQRGDRWLYWGGRGLGYIMKDCSSSRVRGDTNQQQQQKVNWVNYLLGWSFWPWLLVVCWIRVSLPKRVHRGWGGMQGWGDW